MRRYYVPCPHCNEAQFLRWANITWHGRKSTNIQDAKEDLDQEHDVETAGYHCECCCDIWSDGERIASIRNAEKLGVDEAKLTVMRRLDLEKKGPGYCHFPHDRESEWYRQLTAEKLVISYVKGQPIREWHKHDRARNEALDCRVYALAALKIMQPNLKLVAERVLIDVPDQSKAKNIKNS